MVTVKPLIEAWLGTGRRSGNCTDRNQSIRAVLVKSELSM